MNYVLPKICLVFQGSISEGEHAKKSLKNKKRKKTKGVVEGSSQQKDEGFTCYFCKKSGHMKKCCISLALLFVLNLI